MSLLSVEFIILWIFSQSWALKNLPNLYWANVEVAAKHSVMEVFLALTSSVTFVVENALRTSMRLLGSSSRDLITQNATRLISRKTPGPRQRYSSPKSTPFSLLLPQCTERAQRAHVARASAVFDFLPSPLHLLGIKNCGTKG